MTTQTKNPGAPPVRVVEIGFATNHLLVISLVRQDQDKAYKSPFYAFFSGAPAGKNGVSKTYLRDREHAVIFKLDMPRLNAVRFALLAHATGAGNNIAKPYYHWADPSKANVSEGGKITKGKNFSISSAANIRSPGERIVTIAFSAGKEVTIQGQKKEEKGESFQLTFHPFEAMSVADSIQHIIGKARELEALELNQRNLAARAGRTDQHAAKTTGPDDFVDLGGFWDTEPNESGRPPTEPRPAAAQTTTQGQSRAAQPAGQPQGNKASGPQGQRTGSQPRPQTQANSNAARSGYQPRYSREVDIF